MANLRVNKIAASGQTSENTGSVYFDGTGDYLTVANSTDFNYGSDDFSIEAWVYYPSSASDSDNHGIASHYITSGNKRSWLFMLSGATPSFLASSDGTSGNLITVSSSVDVADDTWTHVAVSRTGTTLTIYVNGVQRAQNSSWHSSIYSNTDNPVEIGGYNSGTNTFDGFISNLRICKGHRVYTSNFVVPTRELDVHQGTDDNRTVLLCCHDGENIFAEKTGKIIAAIGDRLSSPTPTATDSPIGITTFQPGLTRNVDPTAGPTFQGGVGFVSQNWLTLPKGTTTQRSGGRGIYAGLRSSTASGGSGTKNMQFWHIPSGGIGQDFGDLVNANSEGMALSSATRGVFAGGFVSPAYINVIEYVTIAATGNAVDFGDLLASIRGAMPLANSTRGIFGGDNDGLTIDFITIATLGNAQDFGDFSSPASGKRERGASFASPTRGIFAGGKNAPSGVTNAIDYITISSLGDTTNFGDLLQQLDVPTGCSSSTRGVIAGGTTPTYQNTIQYITISTLGDAQDFGDLRETQSGQSGMTNSIRGVFDGGYAPNNPTATRLPNIIDFVTIVSTGNSVDFGDIGLGRGYATCNNSASDSHGGLS